MRLSETKVALISFAHGINDMYACLLPTFMPFIRTNLGLSYALVGSFSVLFGFIDMIGQPIIGFFCDRIRRPYMMMIGPILCGIGAVMLPNSPSYAIALFFAGFWGLGTAFTHAQGAGAIGYVSKPERLRQSMTMFNIIGTVGAALGPFVAVIVVTAFGYRRLPVTLIPAFIIAPLIFFSMPRLRNEIISTEKNSGFYRTLLSLFKLLYPIWGVNVIRELVFLGVRFLLPMKIDAQGGDLESIATIVLCITIGCSLSMIPMIKIAGYCGNKRALQGSLLAGAIVLLAAALSAGLFSIALYVLGTACVFSSISLTTIMAQKLAPNERSMASTIVSGFAWGFANMLVLPFGKLADLFGLDAALIVLALTPLLAAPFFLTRPFKMLND